MRGQRKQDRGVGGVPRPGSNIFTRRAIMETGWDSEKYTNDSSLGRRHRGEGPHISILMDINNMKKKKGRRSKCLRDNLFASSSLQPRSHKQTVITLNCFWWGQGNVCDT